MFVCMQMLAVKRANKLAIRRKNWKILTVNRTKG